MSLGLGIDIWLGQRPVSAVVSAAAAWVNTANTTVAASPLGTDWARITKTGGTNGTLTDAAAKTATSFAGDFTLFMRRGQTAGESLLGVSASPSATYMAIDRGLDFSVSNMVSFQTGYTGAAGLGAFTTSQYWIIQRVSGVVSVYMNPTAPDVASAGAALRAWAAGDNAVYFGDVVLGPSGDFVDVKMQ